MIAGQPTWPTKEPANYTVARTAPSYSYISDQIVKTVTQHSHLTFARDMAAIYATLSDRQIRLGEEFESAIFEDLDSLYEA